MSQPKYTVRTVFLSDLHLGYPNRRVGEILRFLESIEWENLYLLGDILDSAWVKKLFFQASPERAVIEHILAKAREGRTVRYTPGNHDDTLKSLAGSNRLGVEIDIAFLYESLQGERYLCTHGDQFDRLITPNRLKYVSSAYGYAFACSVDRSLGRAQRRLLGRSSSVCRTVKGRWPGLSARFRAFERNAVNAAVEAEVHGVICGHTHDPKIVRTDDGIVYINTGDWLDHGSAVVETLDGRMSLVSWEPAFTCQTTTELSLALA